MESNGKAHQSRNSLAPVHAPSSRRQSLSAQLTRSARRFSAAVAPQLTKLEPLPVLQQHKMLNLKIVNIVQLYTAIEQYVVRNGVQFNPIEFELTNENDEKVLKVTLSPDEMSLIDGAKKVFNLSFNDLENDGDGVCISQVKHPVSGIKIFEFIEMPLTNIVQVSSSVDNGERCLVYPETSIWLRMFTSCGCFFSSLQWHFRKEGAPYATVRSNGSFFKENSIRMEWNEQCDNDLRLLVVAFAMTQLVREAFPSLIHILRERRQRKG